MPKKQSKKTVHHHKNNMISIHPHEIEPWRVFKIMAEFVMGYEFINKHDKAVTFFGTARHGFDSEVYQEARKLAFKMSKDGYSVITGGGPGVMEAANHGAFEAGGCSVGLNIKLSGDADTERRNQYVKEAEAFSYFFVRKVMLSFASQVYVYFPGGFGTLDELFEIITLVQTKKIPAIPIILVNKKYWQPLLDWIEEVIYKENKAINKEDMELYHLVDNADEAFKLLKKLTKK
jgi:uncharacterized protein (TIGR00730 family)